MHSSCSLTDARARMHALHHMSLAELERKKFPHHQSQAGSSLLHCMGQVRHVRQPNKPAISYAEGLAEGRCRQPNASLMYVHRQTSRGLCLVACSFKCSLLFLPALLAHMHALAPRGTGSRETLKNLAPREAV
jgi:hypothetical protein